MSNYSGTMTNTDKLAPTRTGANPMDPMDLAIYGNAIDAAFVMLCFWCYPSCKRKGGILSYASTISIISFAQRAAASRAAASRAAAFVR
jgi:hypothetical protein